MKIISKFKDFYDGLNPDYDPDIVYVRNPEVIRDTDQVAKCYKLINSTFEAEYGLHWGREKYTCRYYNRTDYLFVRDLIETSNVLFGIFPKIYSSPIISIHNKSSVMPNSLLDELSKTNMDSAKDAVIKYAMVEKKALPYGKEGKFTALVKNSLPKSVECKEVFEELKAPVFVCVGGRSDKILGESSAYGNLLDWKDKSCILTNICFNKLNANPIGPFADELVSINTPINIENFLWASKTEPVSEPDNKTKILNHGFDLKTSFRKM